MTSSAYYPTGAGFDNSAPWNVADPDAEVADICFACSMSRTAATSTTDYVQGEAYRDEDGVPCRDIDFSSTDWLAEWRHQHLTPIQLIAILQSIASSLASGAGAPRKSAAEWAVIAAECRGWETDDEYTSEI